MGYPPERTSRVDTHFATFRNWDCFHMPKSTEVGRPPPILLEAALAYAKRGWHVHTLHPGTKEPATKHGFKDATINPVVIERLWRAQPYNIGIRTGRISRLFIVDFDPGSDLGGLTPTVETGRGWQAWFETDLDLPCTAGRLGPNIDTRGNGGYVVGSPSTHPNGKQYRWVHQGDMAPDGLPILASMPDWLVERVRRKPASERAIEAAGLNRQPALRLPQQPGYGQAALAGEVATLAAAPKGQRNAILNLVAFKLFQLVAGGELAIETVKAALIDACQRNGLIADDGIGSVLRTIQSAMAGLQFPRRRTA